MPCWPSICDDARIVSSCAHDCVGDGSARRPAAGETEGGESMIREMMDRAKSRVGIYGTGWSSESVAGLLLPIVTVLLLGVVAWLFVQAIQAL